MAETPYRHYRLYEPDASPDLTESGEYNSAVMAIDADIHGLNVADDGLSKRLEAEIAARTQADTALGGRIDTEKSERTQADTALGGRIDTEKSERTQADTALGGRIDTEKQARESADTALGGRIDTEKQAREAADTALGGRIDTEKQAREAADTALGGRIDTEKQRITQEIADRKAADMVLFDANKEIPDAVWSVIKRSPHQTVADGNRYYMYCSLSNTKSVPNKVQYTSVYFVDPVTPEENNESVKVAMAGAIYDLNTKAKLDIGEFRLVLHRYFDFAHLKKKPFSTIGRGLKVANDALMIDEGALPRGITPDTTWAQIEA